MCAHAQPLSHVQLCNAMACSLPGSSVMGFSRQETWSGLLFPPASGLLDPEIEPEFPVPPALADGFFTTESPGNTINLDVHEN